MPLRFSNDGPEFPNKFVDSLLAGELIFLCGTGVSAPQLPDFQLLVECTYAALGIEKTDSEQSAFNEGRYEEVLGSLSRRLSDPYAVTHKVSELLAVPDHPNLSQHRTILRLSRDLDNRISVVTTNFDTFLERAVTEVMPSETPRDISFAGQALPAPGGSAFSGIIHIHGRLTDGALGLESTPLVLTSADYGDAYMRSGWASRFLFDLARCKAIVLVGYSANDAPVRYFLNVLEADRTRFPDLKPVYAFDAYECDEEEATCSWGTLAVEPLPYCKFNSDTGEPDHSPLWRDLAALAEVAERPKHSRRNRARTILKRPVRDASGDSRRELSWLFGGQRDLWSVALDALVDPGWFKVFQDEGLWSAEDSVWVISTWVSKDFKNRERLDCAREWQQRLGRPFTEKIEQLLSQANSLDETWTRVWRLFCLVKPVSRNTWACYLMRKRLESNVVMYSDLEEAVSLLALRPVFSGSELTLREHNSNQPIERLSEIFSLRTAVDRHGAGELIDSLCALPDRAIEILDLATAELRSALELETELELIVDDFDINNSSVASIEKHAQNEYRGGVNFLVRLLADSLSQATTLDRDYTRGVVRGWANMPGWIGLRLCLHAMRDAELFDADEAMSTLLAASNIDFWAIRREIALLLKDRAGTASPTLVSRIEKRIRQTGDAYYDRYPVGPGNTDWRAHARDAAVWLRLNMLQDARVLSDIGTAELSAIKERRDDLNRAVEDRDFFGVYSYGVRSVIGDPAPIIEAPEGERLQVAHELADSPDPIMRHGWSAFCRSHPQGAFVLLNKDELTPENGALWNQFLSALVSDDEASKGIRNDLTVQAFEYLSRFDADTLLPVLSILSDLIRYGPRKHITDVEIWLEKLWEIVSGQTEDPLDLSSDLYDRAINSIAGRLTETLLLEMESKKQQDVTSSDVQRQLIRRIAANEGTAGQLGRAVLTRQVAFLISIERDCVIDILAPRISASDEEGAALRAIMLSSTAISQEITQLLGETVKKGAVESDASDHAAVTVAANVLRPAIADLREDHSVRWGLTASEVAQVLRDAPQEIRSGALEVLAQWLQADPAGSEVAWGTIISPFFEKVWPKERKFRDVSLTPHLIDLAVGSGDKFPTAVEFLRPYFSPYDRGHGSLHSIAESEVPEKFPRETLCLLWTVCGPKSRGSFNEMSKIIDRLIEAVPEIEIDRRLQWLEQHAVRFN